MTEASLKTWQRFALLYIAFYIFNEIIFIAIALHSSQCACSKEKQARLLAFAVLAIILNPWYAIIIWSTYGKNNQIGQDQITELLISNQGVLLKAKLWINLWYNSLPEVCRAASGCDREKEGLYTRLGIHQDALSNTCVRWCLEQRCYTKLQHQAEWEATQTNARCISPPNEF